MIAIYLYFIVHFISLVRHIRFSSVTTLRLWIYNKRKVVLKKTYISLVVSFFIIPKYCDDEIWVSDKDIRNSHHKRKLKNNLCFINKMFYWNTKTRELIFRTETLFTA